MKVSILVAFLAVAMAVPTGKDETHKDESNTDAPHTARAKSEDKKEEPTTSSPPRTEPTRSPAELKHCKDLFGRFMDDKFEGLEVHHDVAMLLEKYGGPPGKVNATWTEKDDAPVKTEDLEKRPLPDAEEKYWIYIYGDSDAKTYIRIEHAVHRFSGTPKAFLEVRGTLYFTPDDFCGKSRKAYYTLDDRGFTFDVSYQSCSIGPLVTCVNPATCKHKKNGSILCIAAPSHALLAGLIGGGK